MGEGEGGWILGVGAHSHDLSGGGEAAMMVGWVVSLVVRVLASILSGIFFSMGKGGGWSAGYAG